MDVGRALLAVDTGSQETSFDRFRAALDPQWIEVLTTFKQMADQKILVEGAVTMVNKTAEQTFANGRAAYAFNGSWCVNVYRGMNPGLRYAPMLPPSLNPARSMKIWGGAGTSFVVNAKSPRTGEAIQFLRWMTEEEQQAFLAEKTKNLPANKTSIGKISSVLAGFADDMDVATHPNSYPVQENPVVAEAFAKGIQSILIGEKRPEEVAREVQRIKEKETAKKR